MISVVRGVAAECQGQSLLCNGVEPLELPPEGALPGFGSTGLLCRLPRGQFLSNEHLIPFPGMLQFFLFSTSPQFSVIIVVAVVIHLFT